MRLRAAIIGKSKDFSRIISFFSEKVGFCNCFPKKKIQGEKIELLLIYSEIWKVFMWRKWTVAANLQAMRGDY